MDIWIKLNSQTSGKDKIARLIQYLSRAIWDSIQQKNELNIVLIDKLKSFEYILSSYRKILNFGNCLDFFYASLKTIHNPDVILKLTLTLGKLAQGLYLLGDHIMWLSRTGLLTNVNLNKWTSFSNKYWFLSINMNLCRDFYEILRLLDCNNSERKSKDIKSSNQSNNNNNSICAIRSPQDLLNVTFATYVSMKAHQDIWVDTIKNGCDLFIPATALGYTKLTPRTIGILGVISSLAGLYVILRPTAKLVPN